MPLVTFLVQLLTQARFKSLLTCDACYGKQKKVLSSFPQILLTMHLLAVSIKANCGRKVFPKSLKGSPEYFDGKKAKGKQAAGCTSKSDLELFLYAVKMIRGE